MTTGPAIAPWSGSGSDLELELLDPGSKTLYRLFRHTGGDWEAPLETYRNLRVDPPAGHKSDFAVLYTGDSLHAAAIECRILNIDVNDNYTWAINRAEQYYVVRYTFSAPALFIPIDGHNRSTLGLNGNQRKLMGYEPYQAIAHELQQRYGQVVHGLSWESFHRNQPGRVYALWHHHKDTIGLEITSPAPYPTLIDDLEWKDFLTIYPDITPITA